jgi:hypothetical protein
MIKTEIKTEKIKARTIDGVTIVNTTPHPIRFQNKSGEIVEVPPCGLLVSAKPVEEVVRIVDVPPAIANTNYVDIMRGTTRITFVRTVFQPHPEGERALDLIEAAYPDAIVVGSIVAAQAYPGRVFGIVPVPGFERVAPSEKRYLANKFTTFE